MAQMNSNVTLVRKKFLLVLFGLLAVLAVAVLVLELTNTTYFFHHKKVPATIPVSTTHQTGQKKAQAASAPTAAASTATTSATNSKQLPAASRSSGGTGTVVQPYGTFVSNHLPGQSGSDTKEQSLCGNTPGASCSIQFTNTSSGQTTKLPAQTVGSDGYTLWNWDANTLSSGSWQITVVASLNGQSKTVTDSVKLEIQ